jgi:hypothetical protein
MRSTPLSKPSNKIIHPYMRTSNHSTELAEIKFGVITIYQGFQLVQDVQEYKTLEETWLGKKLGIQHFWSFGCKVFVHVPKEKRNKLDNKGKKCIFIRYSEIGKAYRLCDHVEKKILVNRDWNFDEYADATIEETSNEDNN